MVGLTTWWWCDVFHTRKRQRQPVTSNGMRTFHHFFISYVCPVPCARITPWPSNEIMTITRIQLHTKKTIHIQWEATSKPLLHNLPHPHRKRCTSFTCHFWAHQKRDMLVQLRFGPIHKFERKVSDENGQNSLSWLYVKSRNESKGNKRTANSANANTLPKHILGPSENVSKCLWPWISFGTCVSSSSHRSGTNDFALGPQNFSLRLVKAKGECKMVPLGITRELKIWPDAVSIGSLNGIMSSSAA